MGPTFVIIPQRTTDYIDSNALQVVVMFCSLVHVASVDTATAAAAALLGIENNATSL